jgi:hypothetical protein
MTVIGRGLGEGGKSVMKRRRIVKGSSDGGSGRLLISGTLAGGRSGRLLISGTLAGGRSGRLLISGRGIMRIRVGIRVGIRWSSGSSGILGGKG